MEINTWKEKSKDKQFLLIRRIYEERENHPYSTILWIWREYLFLYKQIFENIDRMNIDYYNKLINGKKKIGTGNQVIG